MIFPEHKAGLYLEHNVHKDHYQTVEKYVEDVESGGCEIGWVNDEQKRKAIEQDSLWVIQWYPKTPIGFIRLAACDLDVLLEAANQSTDKP